MTPGGFQWVEPTGGPAGRGPGRRWWIVAAVVIVVLVVVAGGVLAVRKWTANDGPQAEKPRVAAPVGTPKDLLIDFPLNRQPVPGWRLDAAAIGLPAGESIPPDSVGSLFGRAGQNAFFMAQRGCILGGPCLDPTGWMYGIDTTSGKPLFPPVRLPDLYTGSCHLNGPDTVVCLGQSRPVGDATPPSVLWVIDAHSGAVTHTGPTDLDTPTGPKLAEVGTRHGFVRLVAKADGKGLYGIGSEGEPTWFAPGDGVPDGSLDVADDVPAPTMTTQGPVNGEEPRRVFSTVDGKDLTPDVPEGATIAAPQVYNGGFAYQFDDGKGKTGVLFYDTSGDTAGREESADRVRLQPNSVMPVLMIGPNLQIYTADGKLVTQVPTNDIISQSQIIGTKFYLFMGGYGDDASWQQWDLLTGKPGATCEYQLGVTYTGSDGNVLLTQRRLDGPTEAVDHTTCQTLWSVPEKSQLWKVGSNLIQVADDVASITSLRAPA